MNRRTSDNGSGIAIADAMEALSAEVLSRCLKRLNTWRAPPNWSVFDWFEEIKAIGIAAAWQAELEFDPSHHVPLSAFLYQRILARVFTRYRQEWAYSLHTAPEFDEELVGPAFQGDALHSTETIHESICDVVDELPSPDRRLIKLLFWQERTEGKIALAMSISQSTVSKRKLSIFRRLRRRFKATAAPGRAAEIS